MCAEQVNLDPLDLQLICRLFLSPRTRQLGLVKTALEFRGHTTNLSQSFTLLSEKKTGEATFSDLLALNEVCKGEPFAWSLAHDRHRTSIRWIQIYTEKYLLPTRLDKY